MQYISRKRIIVYMKVLTTEISFIFADRLFFLSKQFPRGFFGSGSWISNEHSDKI